MKAIWNGKTIAESGNTIVVENNHYFPEDSIDKDYFVLTNHHTSCAWKGQASYYSIEVDGKKNENAAGFIPVPKTPPPISKIISLFGKGLR